MILEEVGKNIERIRLAKGWTINHAANKAMLSWSHLKKIESGKCNFRLETIFKIVRSWQVPLTDLFESSPKRK